MNNDIKIGGCYKTQEGWLLVLNKSSKDTWQTRDIIVDELGYDEEIRDLTEKQIKEMADLSICYRPYYGKNGKGLYAVWDETKPKSEMIYLQ